MKARESTTTCSAPPARRLPRASKLQCGANNHKKQDACAAMGTSLHSAAAQSIRGSKRDPRGAAACSARSTRRAWEARPRSTASVAGMGGRRKSMRSSWGTCFREFCRVRAAVTRSGSWTSRKRGSRASWSHAASTSMRPFPRVSMRLKASKARSRSRSTSRSRPSRTRAAKRPCSNRAKWPPSRLPKEASNAVSAILRTWTRP
mmetsp:Transcript_3828/g.12105  ORF Transcript_3828/g.12105 Transcript_3828/m.12105 type:complete len:204 (-) Transcript_3828:343-954(-)